MAFGEGFTIQYQSVRDKVMALLTNYYNKVFTEHHRTKPKKKGTVFVSKSMRYLNKAWRKSSMVVMKNRRKISTPIDSLLDIGTDLDQLTGDEAAVYTSHWQNK